MKVLILHRLLVDYEEDFEILDATEIRKLITMNCEGDFAVLDTVEIQKMMIVINLVTFHEGTMIFHSF